MAAHEASYKWCTEAGRDGIDVQAELRAAANHKVSRAAQQPCGTRPVTKAATAIATIFETDTNGWMATFLEQLSPANTVATAPDMFPTCPPAPSPSSAGGSLLVRVSADFLHTC